MGDGRERFAVQCPVCDARTQFDPVYGGKTLTNGMRGASVQEVAAECCVCQSLLIGHRSGGWFVPADGRAIVGKAFPDVPSPIAAAASQAYMCSQAGAPYGAMILARAVIEATAKEKQIVTGGLLAKIDELHSQGVIREYVRAGAHEVRHFGNEIAHGDLVAAIDPADVELALELMGEVLREVFQAPARVAAATAKRQAAASPPQQTT
ncbi:DUF4145 domain-containing protein [Actinokineospora globicatena]|uniref:DUF4145 domain-containing protein n=1 Tax=Actinokineospora globicatena TaxID=103729 RepID=A0A9W6QK19_9PSEU|nr:DUF4145 domain-containing protein [Actinokineospora globicatena]GLW92461.1 hypothetical protein Aglo03_32770 [Actinokineospora globicatena]